MPTQIATEGELFLQLLNPANVEVITEIPSIEVIGRTRIDAVVTVNDSLVEPDVDGRFTSAVQLEESPNIIEVATSVASGEQIDLARAEASRERAQERLRQRESVDMARAQAALERSLIRIKVAGPG